jgi:hypothetical protein
MLVLRRLRKDPLAIDSVIFVLTLVAMDETAALSAGLVHFATSHVKISVTTYSICQFVVCNRREDNARRELPEPQAEVISATQLSESGQAKLRIVAIDASTNTASSAGLNAHISTFVERLPGISTISSTILGCILGTEVGEVVGL